MFRSKPDLWMTLALAGISIFGFLNILGIRPDLLSNYSIFLVVGWLAYLISSQLPLSLLEQNYKLMYSFFIFLLIATYLFFDPIRGSHRWIDFGFFQFQVSEFFKPVFLITIAAIFSSSNKFTPRKIFIVIALFVVPFFLILKQPDLGSALLFLASWLCMFYFSGLSTRLVVRFAALGAMILPFGWFFLRDYQKNRILGFLDPSLDPQGITYNLNQAIISVGSGGIFGKGMGLGTQARFRFLPEFHTDFAFASLTEQFGFLGAALLLLLFAVVVYRLIRKVFNHPDSSFRYIFGIGVLVILVSEIVVNVGMNMGLLPVTGIALPFISYGGSSILSTMIMLGMASRL